MFWKSIERYWKSIVKVLKKVYNVKASPQANYFYTIFISRGYNIHVGFAQTAAVSRLIAARILRMASPRSDATTANFLR